MMPECGQLELELRKLGSEQVSLVFSGGGGAATISGKTRLVKGVAGLADKVLAL